MPNTHLTFNQFVFNPYPVNGSEEIYLKSDELAQALGYKETDSITKIYNRNQDEFERGMSETVKLTVSGNLKKTIRVFSLRGANLVAMKAQTPIANEFRKWVLDVLEGKVSDPHLPQMDRLANNRDLHLSDGVIRVVNGLYRLTDLTNIKKRRENLTEDSKPQPGKWWRSAKATAFIEAIAKEYGASNIDSVLKIVRSYDADASGTYAVREILVEFARWLGRPYLLEVERALQAETAPVATLPIEPSGPIAPEQHAHCHAKVQPQTKPANRGELEEQAVKEISQLRAICMLIKRHADLGEKLDPEILEPTMWAALDRIDALDEIVGRTFDSNK
ncbi:BRO family protein [Vibrio cholerae]|nr:BRO family, N- domain protein [Vibrio cholerae]